MNDDAKDLLENHRDYNLVEAIAFLRGEKEYLYQSSINPNHPKGVNGRVAEELNAPIAYRMRGGDVADMIIAQSEESLSSIDDIYEDAEFAQVLGYPECCVASFSTSLQDDRILRKVSEFDTYPFYMNRLSRTHAILSHFPCQFDCKESENIGRRRADLLEAYDEMKYEAFRDALSAFYIYISGVGLYEAQEYEISTSVNQLPVEINYEEFAGVEPLNEGTIITEPDSETLDHLNSHTSLTVNSHDEVVVGDETLSGENVRAIAFTPEHNR